MQTKTTRADAYQIITDKIIATLQAGAVPWRKPWSSAGAPRNIDARPYRGINAFLLALAPYEIPVYLTYRKAQEMGANVKKGEHGFPVVFWKNLKQPGTGAPVAQEADDHDDNRPRFVLRYYHVFNVAQVEGIPPETMPEVKTYPHNPIEEAQAIISGMPNRPAIQNGPRAFYRPDIDTVTTPPLERFEQPEEYYSTIFHELSHAVGHRSRLDRKSLTQMADFGSADYSREELVAEMSAAFLCGQCGITPATLDNSTAYIENWIAVLKADSKAVVIAAAQAQKAADYILAAPGNHETETQETP